MRQFARLSNRNINKELPKGSKNIPITKVEKQPTINYIQYPLI
jgi:hypothetical protein